MGKLVVDMFTTLDGVIQAPGGKAEDTEDGYPYGGWQAQFFDEESGTMITKNIQKTDALLLGRKTYDIFAGYWPKAPKGPISDTLNKMPKYVASRRTASRRPRKITWANAKQIQGDVAKEIPKIKAKHKEIHTIGSSDLVQTLLKHGLVDRFNIWQYPVVLGQGKRLFEEGAPPTRLRLVETKAFPGGGVLLVYEPAGKPTFKDIDA
jgi:dihydrofolate reductase